MELRQLEYLIAVHEQGSFTKAAATVHISQSGVSAQIRQLERELGQQLVDRSDRIIRLTAAGTAVLPFAQTAVAAVRGAREAVDELSGLVRGQIAVGMVTGCTMPGFFDALASFRLHHPQIRLALAEGSSDELIQRVRDGSLDLAIVGTHGRETDGMVSVIIADEPLVAAVPPAHELAGSAPVTVHELKERDVICMPTGSGVRAAFDSACALAGAAVSVALEASAPNIVADLAVRGLGVAVLPASMVAANSQLCTVELLEPVPRTRLELVWRHTGASPAARALGRHLRAALVLPPAG